MADFTSPSSTSGLRTLAEKVSDVHDRHSTLSRWFNRATEGFINWLYPISSPRFLSDFRKVFYWLFVRFLDAPPRSLKSLKRLMSILEKLNEKEPHFLRESFESRSTFQPCHYAVVSCLPGMKKIMINESNVELING